MRRIIAPAIFALLSVTSGLAKSPIDRRDGHNDAFMRGRRTNRS
jgi:hypothetical protein